MIKPFADTLRELSGDVQTELALELQRVLLGVMETAKPGSLTLKLTIKPVTKMNGAVTVKPTITATVPENDNESVFFVTPEGNPSRNHPKQEKLGLEEVSPARREPSVVNA